MKILRLPLYKKIIKKFFLLSLYVCSICAVEECKDDFADPPGYDEQVKIIKSIYPGAQVRTSIGDKHLVSIVDPDNLTEEELVILTEKSGKNEFSKEKLFNIKANSLKMTGYFLIFTGSDGKRNVKKITFRDENIAIDEGLPLHDTVKEWDSLESIGYKLLFAKNVINRGREAEYWTLKNGIWYLICKCKLPEKFLDVDPCGKIYKVSYGDKGLTLEFLNEELELEATNVTEFPVSVVYSDFISSKKNPRVILAVENYKDGVVGYEPAPDQHSFQKDYEEKKKLLKEAIRKKNELFAELDFSVDSLDLGLDDRIVRMQFYYYQNSRISGLARFGELVEIVGLEPFEKLGFSVHPPLQSQKTLTQDIPYCYVPPKNQPNGKSLMLIEGGPVTHYTGSFSEIISLYTGEGWSVIIPQEMLRTGYGWQHYVSGLGEMGRKNLHQLLHIFYDAADKKLIPDLGKVSLYGHSYGGFVATSFALRWDELHVEAELEKRFQFQSIVADAALVCSNAIKIDSNISRSFQMLSWLLPENADYDDFVKRIMPINRTDMTLSAPLSIIHGKRDVTCSAGSIKEFAKSLKLSGRIFSFFWHEGAHNAPEHESYPKFLHRLMEKGDIHELIAEIGLTEEYTTEEQVYLDKSITEVYAVHFSQG